MSYLHINTTQNINIFFTTASVGERMLAYIIDILILTAYTVTMLLLLNGVFDFNIFDISGDSSGVYLLLFVLPIMFYSLVCESTLEGQTVGKKIVKIKVVKIDGYQAGFFDYFIRWVFAIVDIQMAAVPGIIAMVSTKHTQRLGDLAAGTAVVSEKSKYNINHTILMDVADDYKPHFSRNQVILFSDNDLRIIKENFELAVKDKNPVLIQKLANKICAVMKTENEFKTEQELIKTFLKDYNYHTSV